MAYENYATVAWTNGTPITADRLQQMSINSDQIKEATDDNPKGIIKRKIGDSVTIAANTFNTDTTIIELKNEAGGANNSITLPANRFVKASFNFAGIVLGGAGGEDSIFEIKLIQGTESSAIYTWKVSPPINLFLNNASANAPSFGTLTLDDFETRSANPLNFGGGTYTHLFDSSTGLKEVDGTGIFKIAIERSAGPSTANLPSFIVSGPTHFWIEDVGGTA
jgi:hypothetical protein